MAFPEVPRVIYEKNPLEEVICQLRYPTILKIDAESPVAYQEQIRADYPYYERKPAFKFPLGLPPDVAQMVVSNLSFGGQDSHDFSSRDRFWDLKLNRDFIALTCRSYSRWEDFCQRLVGPFGALTAQYQPSFFTRIGLRYRNVIRPSRLQLQGHPWNELLQPWVSGVLGSSDAAGDVEIMGTTTLIRLPDEVGKTQVSFGLALDQTTNENVFIIDADFFTEQQTDASDVFKRLDAFHRQAGFLFHWCITDRLHEAMGPRAVPAA
jgi:uncharacterized protein (TIGR04255 family)